MSEKLSDQNVRLKLSFGDFKLSVEASESFVKHALRDCLDEVLDANIFGNLEGASNQIENANTIKISDEIASKDLQTQTEYSMNSMVN